MICVRRVSGTSMEPLLKDGQFMLGYTRKQVKIEDVVIARYNDTEIIKIVQSVSGDRVLLVGAASDQTFPIDAGDIVAVVPKMLYRKKI